MKSQQDVEKFILKLQEDVSFDISLSNSIILYQKAQNSRTTYEAADCYSKAIILLQDALMRKKCINSVQQLLDICIQNVDCLQLNPQVPENQQINNQIVETLEQINHIDQLEDKIIFIIKRINNILQKGGMLTQHVYFHPRFWDQQATDSRPRIIIYKFCSQSIDKLIVLYKYTPEAEIKNLSCELLDTLQNLQQLVKNKQVKEQEDLLYWLQQFFKSSSQLVDLFHEKYGRVPSNLKDQIYQEIYKVAQSGILEIQSQIKPEAKKIFLKLKPLSALEFIRNSDKPTVIYPLRPTERPANLNMTQSQRQQSGVIPLFEDPINHINGKPKCIISIKEWDGICKQCNNKKYELDDWYYDLTLSIIINQYKVQPNKRDIVQCVKFYNDGEYEILYTEYAEAVETDQYIEDDPVIKQLKETQKLIVDKVANLENVILEQNPVLIAKFTELVDNAFLQQ